MIKTYLLDLAGSDIRFTPEGKVAVLDAIEALCAIDPPEPERVWQRLVASVPEIETLCETYCFSDRSPAVVVDGTGWSVIQALLPEHGLC